MPRRIHNTAAIICDFNFSIFQFLIIRFYMHVLCVYTGDFISSQALYYTAAQYRYASCIIYLIYIYGELRSKNGALNNAMITQFSKKGFLTNSLQRDRIVSLRIVYILYNRTARRLAGVVFTETR